MLGNNKNYILCKLKQNVDVQHYTRTIRMILKVLKHGLTETRISEKNIMKFIKMNFRVVFFVAWYTYAFDSGRR